MKTSIHKCTTTPSNGTMNIASNDTNTNVTSAHANNTRTTITRRNQLLSVLMLLFVMIRESFFPLTPQHPPRIRTHATTLVRLHVRIHIRLHMKQLVFLTQRTILRYTIPCELQKRRSIPRIWAM